MVNVPKGRPASANAEIKRTAHWRSSRRGPAFLGPLFRLGDKSLQGVAAAVQRARSSQTLDADGGTIHSRWLIWSGPRGGSTRSIWLGSASCRSGKRRRNAVAGSSKPLIDSRRSESQRRRGTSIPQLRTACYVRRPRQAIRRGRNKRGSSSDGAGRSEPWRRASWVTSTGPNGRRSSRDFMSKRAALTRRDGPE